MNDMGYLISLVSTFVLALIFSWGILFPFFQKQSEKEVKGVDLISLTERKEQLLSSLTELEQDYLAGKISESDYEHSKKELTFETAECLEKLEKL